MLTYSDYFLTLFVVLAFALADTKKIILCDVEKPESLHSFSVEAPVSCMHWTEVTVESR
jgi:anaphase-promoting complex subunit 4